MWEKTAFLLYFASLCLAQRAAIADLQGEFSVALLHGTQINIPTEHQPFNSPRLGESIATATDVRIVATPSSPPIAFLNKQIRQANGAGESTRVVINGLPSNVAGPVASLVQTQDTAVSQTFAVVYAAGASPLPSGVFTSVLFPDVPTAAPTGVIVPTIYTYTGSFDPSLVPSGYSFVTPPMTETKPTNMPTSKLSMSHLMSSMSSMPSMRPSSTLVSSTTSKSSTTSSKTSSTSTTSLTTSSVSSTFSASKSSSTSSSATNGQANRPTDPPQRTGKLSDRAVAGIVAGLLCGLILLAALIFALFQRKRSRRTPDSPGIYPQEAYLYDPPITPPPGVSGPGGSSGRSSDIPRGASPEMTGAESVGLLGAAAVGAGTTGSASNSPRRSRGIALADPGPTAGPSRWNGYSPVDSTDIVDGHRSDPFSDSQYSYHDDAEAPGPHDSWPLNRELGSTLDPSAGPSGASAANSGTVAGPSGTSPGPSALPRLGTGPTHVGGVGTGAGASPHMQEVRRAWGWEQ
jgi:hypothetical protein